MDFEWVYKAECLNVVDGDTYDLRVDLGFNTTKDIRVRLSGVDTNETYGVPKESEEYRRGAEQTRFVTEWFNDSDELIVKTVKDSKGKYGRYLADVVNGSKEKLSEAILSEYPHTEA